MDIYPLPNTYVYTPTHIPILTWTPIHTYIHTYIYIHIKLYILEYLRT